MAKLKLLSTIFSKLGSLIKNNGQIIVTRDSKSLYIDLEGERIEITDWIDIDTEESLLAILSPLINKYYYTKDTNKIWRYINSEWECLNTSVNDLTPTYTESSTLVKLSSGEKLSISLGKISKAITDLISHIGDSIKHITNTERTNWDLAKTHADSDHARTDATNVEKSSTNGNIKINGSETNVYTHPSGTNPHGTTKSDVGLGNVGNFKAVSTVASQDLTDTEKSNARTNISAAASSHTHTKSQITDFPTSLTANGGNADTVNGHTVESDVPVNAKFTDTVYDDTELKGSIAELNSSLSRFINTTPILDLIQDVRGNSNYSYTVTEDGLYSINNCIDAKDSTSHDLTAGIVINNKTVQKNRFNGSYAFASASITIPLKSGDVIKFFYVISNNVTDEQTILLYKLF